MTANIVRPAARSSARGGALAILDQAIVSGTNFCATILVGRATSRSELGAYALGFSVVVLTLAMQQALVCLPFTVFAPRATAVRRRRLLGSALLIGVALAGVASVALVAAAGICSVLPTAVKLSSLWLMLAVAIPFALLRELARRTEFARLQVGRALSLDGFVAALQTGGLATLYFTKYLTPLTAIACLGGSCAVVVTAWLLRNRHELRFRWRLLPQDIQRNWQLGRWALAGNLVSFGNAYLLHWVLAARLGVDSLGALAACWTLIDLSNPFVIGLTNWLGPRCSHALHTEGVSGLRRFTLLGGGVISATMAAYAISLSFLGGTVIQWLFKPEYAPPITVVALLAWSAFASASAAATTDALTLLERQRVNLAAGILSLVLGASLAWILTGPFYLVGGAAAFLAASLLSAVIRIGTFERVTRPACAEVRR